MSVTDPPKTCVVCGEEAVTTAAHIPVCQQHYDRYRKEAKRGAERPFWDYLCWLADHKFRKEPPDAT